MAKKRGPGRPKGSTNKKKAKEQSARLSKSFWAQTAAVLMVVFSLILLLGLFAVGGNLPLGLAQAFLWSIGWTAWVLPLILIWQAVAIFRAEDNKLSMGVWPATVVVLICLSGLAQLTLTVPTVLQPHLGGGAIGWLADSGMLSLFTATPLALIYVVLIFLLILFALAVNPKVVFDKLGELFKRDESITQKNQAVAEQAKGAKTQEFQINTIGGEAPSASKKLTKKPFKTEETNKKVVQTEAIKDANWKFPKVSLLSEQKSETDADAGDVKGNADIIKDTLAEFGINVTMEGVNIGPRVAQYTLKPAAGVKLSRIANLEQNLSLNLAAEHIRIEAPIPGKPSVGIEVPNLKAANVSLRGILEKSDAWKNATTPLTFAIGRDISGKPIIADLAKLPHLLIAGQTGSGKSVMMNTLITSLLYRATPNQMKLIMIDPKGNELGQYDDIAHLAAPIVKGTSEEEVRKAIKALHWVVTEMERRFKMFGNVKNLKDWNKKHPEEALPYMVVVIDELYDLIMSSKTAERDIMSSIQRLAQKGRASGIHVVVATQRPEVKVIPGSIKANITAALAFAVKSSIDSRVILDQSGAEKLLGNGDMLMKTTEMRNLKRVQGAFIDDDEVDQIVAYIKLQSEPKYNDDLLAAINQEDNRGSGGAGGGAGDPEYKQAVQVVVAAGKASTSLLQKRLRIGYGKASRIMDDLEENGVVGPQDGARPREVLISSMDELDEA